jgi:nucleoside triphosphate pyrophosphatase
VPNRPRIILASASPRRQELLRKAGIGFVVCPANIEEVPIPHESPSVFAERMAREKACAVLASSPDSVVLAADTVVAVGDQILGKPESEADAARMLRVLSGRKHSVTTAVCLASNRFDDVRSETTAVSFAAMSEDEIREYVNSREPMDKAGAYAIQGRASRWTTKIEGDYYNVVGLPVDLVWRMLREHGLL